MANTGGLRAIVINIMNNQPIEGATVKLSGQENQTTQTGGNGSFEFSNLPAGNDYALNVSKPDFKPENYENIVVIENNVTDLYKLALYPEED